MIVTDTQKQVLRSMRPNTLIYNPRGSLERLAKKGLVEGDRRLGWFITDKGKMYLARLV